MRQRKCNECGQIFNDDLAWCPNCGCPANGNSQIIENEVDNSTSGNVRSINSDAEDYETTDTGYENENRIKSLADTIYKIIMVSATIFSVLVFIGLIASAGETNGVSLLGVFLIILILLIAWGNAIVIKAFLYVYANISINLHEINMKIK